MGREKIKWAVEETVVAPDLVIPGGRERQTLYKIVEDEIIRVWLQKHRRSIHRPHGTPGRASAKGEAMATDSQCEAAYRWLRPYCDVLEEAEELDYGLAAGEQYYALSWLISAILENHATVPQEPLLDAFGLLEDEDKDKYASALDKELAQPT